MQALELDAGGLAADLAAHERLAREAHQGQLHFGWRVQVVVGEDLGLEGVRVGAEEGRRRRRIARIGDADGEVRGIVGRRHGDGPRCGRGRVGGDAQETFAGVHIPGGLTGIAVVGGRDVIDEVKIALRARLVDVQHEETMLAQVDVFHVRVGELDELLALVDDAVAGGDAGGDEFHADRIRTCAGVVTGIGQVIGPGRVDVARQHHHVVDVAGEDAVVDALAFGGVAVPLVEVDRETENLQRRHHHLLAHDLPLGVAGLHLGAEPGELGRAEQVARGIADQLGIGLLVAADQARVEHIKVGQVAEVDAAVDAQRVTRIGLADRLPFEVGLHGLVFAQLPQPFQADGMVFRAAAPSVVCAFVVVPDDDEGIILVQAAQVGVEFVLRMPETVVLQVQDFVEGKMSARIDAVAATFVDVVAEVQDGVHVIALRQDPIGIEPAARIVGAGHHAKAQRVHVTDREGKGAAHDGVATVLLEAVVVPSAGLQAAGVDLDGVVAGVVGRRAAAGHDGGHVGIGPHLPIDGLGAGLVGRDARPKDHAVAHRVTRSDAMVEGGEAAVERGARPHIIRALTRDR